MAPVMAVPVSMSDVPAAVGGYNKLTYSVAARRKTANIDPQVVQIMVKGKPRFQLRSICAETGKRKATFLTAAKTGGRLRR